MHVSFPRYPIDVILCMIWSIILLPFALLDGQGTIRIILGLPFILFIPGYILMFTLFPQKKTDSGIGIIERIALSFGLSLAIVPLIGLGLNYTIWGIRLEPILLSLILFIIGVGIIGIFRWMNLDQTKRFIIKFDIIIPKYDNNIDKILTIILAAAIIIAISILIYIIITPRTGEQFTEFYLLGPNGIADDYPQNLTINETATIIIGLVNHEYQQMNYTIETWLVNQSLQYNQTSNENETIYHEMYYMNTFQTTLNHLPIDIEQPWQPQWETNYTFSISKNGTYKLAFLLFTTPSNQEYEPNINYADIASEKFNQAYRELHLWLTIT